MRFGQRLNFLKLISLLRPNHFVLQFGSVTGKLQREDYDEKKHGEHFGFLRNGFKNALPYILESALGGSE